MPSGERRCAGAAVHGVRCGGGFGEGVGADPLAGGELREVLLLLRCGPVPDDRKGADAGVGAECDRKAGELAHRLGDERGGHLVHLEAAIGLGDIDAHEAKVAGLAEKGAGDGEVLGFDFAGGGHDLVGGEVQGGACAIWRCSSVKSSGVKISSGRRSSIRKLPPLAGVAAIRVSVVAIVRVYRRNAGRGGATSTGRRGSSSGAGSWESARSPGACRPTLRPCSGSD